METIRVPGPPKEAFKKHRPLSDLIREQVRHFQHLEAKLPPEARTPYAGEHIRTEGEAARYIAAMTSLLCSLGGEPVVAETRGLHLVSPSAPPAPAAEPIAIAAVAEEPKRPAKSKARKSAKPAASSKPRSPRKKRS